MPNPLLIFGILTMSLVIVHVIGLVVGAATARQRDRIQWGDWTDRWETRITRKIRAAEYARQFSSAWSGWRKLRVAATHWDSEDCKTFVLQDPDGLPLPTFLPGQFLMIGKPDFEDTGQITSRCYSLSDAPSPDQLQITVKRVPDGLVSCWLHDAVGPGDTLDVRAPAGRFVLDVHCQDLVVGVAAGVGITPIACMARYIAQRQPGRRVVVFMSARDGGHMPLIEGLREIERNNPLVKIIVLSSRPKPDDVFDFKGRLTIDIIASVIGRPMGSYYLCGPTGFMTSLGEAIVDWGVPADSVHFESFGGKAANDAVEAPLSADPVQVHFKKSDRQVSFSPTDSNLLDAAENAGIEIPADCRAGACGTCLTKLLRGSVAYDHPPAYGPLASDECLACVAKPITPTTIDA